jgi:hypothetical protein
MRSVLNAQPTPKTSDNSPAASPEGEAHRACDDLGNVDPALLEDWTEALMRALGAVALKG